MNKYIKYSLACIAGTILVTSCDVMDTSPKASFSEDMVWSTEQSADAFAINTYNSVIGYFSGGSADWESCNPNGIQCSQVGEGIHGLATELGISAYSDYGFGRFGNLRACNVLIKKANESALSEKKKTELIAEGKFLRGCLFFDMARKMGRFVPVTEVYETTDSLKFKQPVTKDVVESYKYVMSDLTDAAYNMPATSYAGRANRYAAHLIRSRAALQAYAYTGERAYLDTCIVSANAVIGSGKYQLTSDYGSLFNEASPTDNEIIFARYYLAEDATAGGFDELIRALPNISADDIANAEGTPMKNPNGRTFECWGIYFPTQDLVDQYLAIDQADGKAKPWYETSQFMENVDNLDANSVTQKGQVDSYTRKSGEPRNIPSTQDLKTGKRDYPQFARYIAVKSGKTANLSDIMYSNRDKRLAATVVYDNSELLGEKIELNLNGNAAQGVRDKEDGGWYNTVSGYYWRKGVYTNMAPRAYVSTKTNYHYVIARLGEAYMNLAEAQLLKGDISAAVSALNATRVKHGGLPGSTASSANEAWADYMRERRVEMAYENGDIYFSYLRWGKYGGAANYGRESAVGKEGGAIIKDLDRPVYKIQISRDRKKALIGQITLLDSWNRNFTERRYLFPIPQGQIDNRRIYGIDDGQNNKGW